MIITKKIVMVGSSLGMIIDKWILEKLKIKKGDIVEINIKKVVR